ncbi:hypothetical protein HY988_02140 [Candidatus Micrarchaeota archaeon]|nr:hypothetical protein [Candidatus Micrarchaeota archaeon]
MAETMLEKKAAETTIRHEQQNLQKMLAERNIPEKFGKGEMRDLAKISVAEGAQTAMKAAVALVHLKRDGEEGIKRFIQNQPSTQEQKKILDALAKTSHGEDLEGVREQILGRNTKPSEVISGWAAQDQTRNQNATAMFTALTKETRAGKIEGQQIFDKIPETRREPTLQAYRELAGSLPSLVERNEALALMVDIKQGKFRMTTDPQNPLVGASTSQERGKLNSTAIFTAVTGNNQGTAEKIYSGLSPDDQKLAMQEFKESLKRIETPEVRVAAALFIREVTAPKLSKKEEAKLDNQARLEASKMFKAIAKGGTEGWKEALDKFKGEKGVDLIGERILKKFDGMAQNLEGEKAADAALFRMRASQAMHGQKFEGWTTTLQKAQETGYASAIGDIRKKEDDQRLD